MQRERAKNALFRAQLDNLMARKLYAQAGMREGRTDLWDAEDEVTRLYYLHLAAQTEATTLPA
jgi:hypothetical protein